MQQFPLHDQGGANLTVTVAKYCAGEFLIVAANVFLGNAVFTQVVSCRHEFSGVGGNNQASAAKAETRLDDDAAEMINELGDAGSVIRPHRYRMEEFLSSEPLRRQPFVVAALDHLGIGNQHEGSRARNYRIFQPGKVNGLGVRTHQHHIDSLPVDDRAQRIGESVGIGARDYIAAIDGVKAH